MNHYVIQLQAYQIIISQADHDAIAANPTAWVTITSLDIYGNPDGSAPFTVWVPFISFMQPYTPVTQ